MCVIYTDQLAGALQTDRQVDVTLEVETVYFLTF